MIGQPTTTTNSRMCFSVTQKVTSRRARFHVIPTKLRHCLVSLGADEHLAATVPMQHESVARFLYYYYPCPSFVFSLAIDISLNLFIAIGLSQ